MTTHAPSTSSNNYRLPPRTSSLNPPVSPGLTPTRHALLQSYTPGSAAGGAASYLHHAEDPLIFEIGSRLLRAGFANESTPRCVLEWSKEVFWCREGIIWSGGKGGEGNKGELWRGDLRSVELGVVEDVVERGVRMAYNKYLLIDSKIKRVMIVVPTCFPTKVLTALVKSIFVHFQMPGIMLLEAPIMATIAAGTRSALIVDLGWEEAVINVVYELRVVGRGGARGRSRRGGKVLRSIWKEFLEAEVKRVSSVPKVKIKDQEVEEILARLGWCRKFGQSKELAVAEGNPVFDISITSTSPPTILKLPFIRLSEPAERTFFASTTVPSSSPEYPDDDDLPIPQLIYEALKDSPIDVRAACMQRIIIVGGGSLVIGVKKRIVDEVRGIVERVGWEKGQSRHKPTQKPVPPPPPPPPPPKDEVKRNSEDEQDLDSEEEEMRRVRYEWRQEVTLSPGSPRGGLEKKGPVEGTPKVKGLESLGNWVGASLVAGMKGRGAVEVEREKFLQTVASGGTGLPFGY